MEAEIVKYPKIITKLDRKIKTCKQLIENYESQHDGASITEISQGLDKEKQRLKIEILKQTDSIAEINEKIKLLNESITILDMKYNSDDDE
jgi:hypothetical protein